MISVKLSELRRIERYKKSRNEAHQLRLHYPTKDIKSYSINDVNIILYIKKPVMSSHPFWSASAGENYYFKAFAFRQIKSRLRHPLR